MSEEIDAGIKLAREFDKLKPLKAAFWLKAGDNDLRYLYFASEQISGANITETYGEVTQLIDGMELIDLNPFRIKLIGANHPLAKAAVEFHDCFPGSPARRLGGRFFGGSWADDIYLYPSPLSVPVA